MYQGLGLMAPHLVQQQGENYWYREPDQDFCQAEFYRVFHNRSKCPGEEKVLKML